VFQIISAHVQLVLQSQLWTMLLDRFLFLLQGRQPSLGYLLEHHTGGLRQSFANPPSPCTLKR
jgi:hypothetical protein